MTITPRREVPSRTSTPKDQTSEFHERTEETAVLTKKLKEKTVQKENVAVYVAKNEG